MKRAALMPSVLNTHTHTHTHTHSKRMQKSFGGNGYIYFLVCGNGIMGICICPNSPKGMH